MNGWAENEWFESPADVCPARHETYTLTFVKHIFISRLPRVAAVGILQAAALAAADFPVSAVSVKNVKIQDEFWTPRIDANRTVTLPILLDHAAAEGPVEGRLIEASAYILSVQQDPALRARIERMFDRTIAQLRRQKGVWANRGDGPGFSAGHFFEGAVAYYDATGDRKLLDAAIEIADDLANTFGPGKRYDIFNHEEIEIGLVKLYRATNNPKYLNLARFFMDVRGTTQGGRQMYGSYSQDDMPVREQPAPSGTRSAPLISTSRLPIWRGSRATRFNIGPDAEDENPFRRQEALSRRPPRASCAAGAPTRATSSRKSRRSASGGWRGRSRSLQADAKTVRDPARRRQVSRVKRSVHARKKRRKVLKEAKGYFGRKHSSYRFAKEQVQRSGMYAYRDRRNRKRDFRRLWITRINAAARLEGMSYSELIHGLSKAEVEVNRKMLAEIAVTRPRCVPPIRGASPGGCGRLAARQHSTFPGGPSLAARFFVPGEETAEQEDEHG